MNSKTTQNFFATVIVIILGLFLVKWIFGLAMSILYSLLPLALVVGGLYVAYQVFGRKALGGGRRTLP